MSLLNKPKIAVLIDWYLPGTKAGGPVRSVYSLVHLLQEHFEFYIITLNKDLGETTPYPEVKSDSLFLKDGFYYYYFSAAKLSDKSLQQVLENIQPDLVYLNSFWSYPFSIQPVRLSHSGQLKTPVLLAPRGMLGKGALSLKSYKKHAYILLAKMFGWYRHVSFHATQVQEKEDVLVRFRGAKVFVAPNINSLPAASNKSTKLKNHLKLFYLSRIARVKNLHFALEILSAVPADLVISYDIYGNLEDKEYWNECLQLIARLPKHVTVSYRQELPFHKVQETLINYNALLMPTLNENFGHSIVESLLCGCAVIISDQTPWNDLAKEDAGFALALDQPAQFTNSVAQLARLDEQEFLQKSNKAINYINNKIDLKRVADQYKNMFNECIKN